MHRNHIAQTCIGLRRKTHKQQLNPRARRIIIHRRNNAVWKHQLQSRVKKRKTPSHQSKASRRRIQLITGHMVILHNIHHNAHRSVQIRHALNQIGRQRKAIRTQPNHDRIQSQSQHHQHQTDRVKHRRSMNNHRHHNQSQRRQRPRHRLRRQTVREQRHGQNNQQLQNQKPRRRRASQKVEQSIHKKIRLK